MMCTGFGAPICQGRAADHCSSLWTCHVLRRVLPQFYQPVRRMSALPSLTFLFSCLIVINVLIVLVVLLSVSVSMSTPYHAIVRRCLASATTMDAREYAVKSSSPAPMTLRLANFVIMMRAGMHKTVQVPRATPYKHQISRSRTSNNLLISKHL
jgi:hypothetical protein